MIRLQVSRRSASSADVEQALTRLDHQAGVYFGCDAGITGLHPLQATLLDGPALSLHLFTDGLGVQACSTFGQALLQHAALSGWADAARPGKGRHAVESLRALMASFAALPEFILLGALPFHAHRLAASKPAADHESLGLLFLAETYWQRDADGQWQRIRLSLPGQSAAVPTSAINAAPSPADSLEPPQDDYPPGGYAEMVERALGLLRQPPLVSLTLSQSYRRPVPADLSATQAFARLRQVNPAPATFFLNDGAGQKLFGASPDLQLVIAQGQIEALPVCGTVARGAGPVGEAESVRELLNEQVDAASLAVCSDALRNDLAPLCEPGSLRLLDRRRPMALSTVVHTVDRLAGRLRAGVDAWDAIVATAAPVMVTGTPRESALAAIAAMEASPRGWYGGLFVRVSGDGDALVGTILRAAVLQHGVAEVRCGGDLLADSTPEREERESRLKAISLWRALGMSEDPKGSIQAAAPFTGKLPSRIALHDAGDPFPAAVADAMQSLGLHLDSAAGLSLLIGADPRVCRQVLDVRAHRPLLAIGDAALRVLEHAGFAIEAIAPAHGRLLLCQPTALAPWSDASSFSSARYASLGLADSRVLPGWDCWALDQQQRPVLLVHEQSRTACLLFRPDSLLSGAPALAVLRATLAWLSSAA